MRYIVQGDEGYLMRWSVGVHSLVPCSDIGDAARLTLDEAQDAVARYSGRIMEAPAGPIAVTQLVDLCKASAVDAAKRIRYELLGVESTPGTMPPEGIKPPRFVTVNEARAIVTRPRRRWAVVVPSNRPDRLQSFLGAWEDLFSDHAVDVIIVDDTPDGSCSDACTWTCLRKHRKEPVSWAPAGTDMCRSYGFYRAWKTGVEFVLSLDDDTLPVGDPFAAYEAVFDAGAPLSPYLNVGALTSFGGPMRGFPFGDRAKAEVVVQWGGWSGVLDYDAPTQLAGVSAEESFAEVVLPVPVGAAVTGCAMNMAFRREWVPMMWQLPLFEGRHNRWGDIWSGLFAKRVADAVGAVCVVNGKAQVRHERASDPLANLARESPGIPLNEHLWEATALPWKDAPLVVLYEEVTGYAAEHFAKHDPEYAEHFLAACDEWLGLFDAH